VSDRKRRRVFWLGDGPVAGEPLLLALITKGAQRDGAPDGGHVSDQAGRWPTHGGGRREEKESAGCKSAGAPAARRLFRGEEALMRWACIHAHAEIAHALSLLSPGDRKRGRGHKRAHGAWKGERREANALVSFLPNLACLARARGPRPARVRALPAQGCVAGGGLGEGQGARGVRGQDGRYGRAYLECK
jgi:hypothetical protein